MKAPLFFFFVFTSMLVRAQNMGNPVDLREGDVGFIKGQQFIGLELIEDNLMIDDLPQSQYIEQHKTERNEKRPGTGDTWEKGWTENFTAYHRSFIKGFEELSKLTVKEGSVYTMRVKIDKLSPGFETGIGLMGKGSQMFGEALIVKASEPNKVLARFSFEKVKGEQKFDLKTRLDFCYYRGGYWIGWTLFENVKKSNKTEPSVVGVEAAPTQASTAKQPQPVTPVLKTNPAPTPATTIPAPVAATVQPTAPSNTQAKVAGPSNQNADINVRTIKIGPQVWATKNLDVSTFNNGDPIPEAKTSDGWKKAGEAKEPAWCYLSNDPTNGDAYGKLYNWFAVADPRGLAPAGWHIPTEGDWRILLEITLGAEKELKDILKKDLSGAAMKSKSGWDKDGNGNNTTGFDGQPGGSRRPNGEFVIVGVEGNWWSATEFKTHYSWNCSLFAVRESSYKKVSDKSNGFSIRCVRD